MLLLRSSSLDDTHAIAAAIAGAGAAGDVIVLAGEMGAGKTAFAQGFGRALGVDRADHVADVHARAQLRRAEVGRSTVTLHHADLYRLDRTAEVADLALGELAEFDGIVLVEWGDVVEATLGEHLVVRLEHDDERDDRPTADEVDGELDAGRADDVRLDRDRRRAVPPGRRGGRAVVAAVEAYRC